MKRMSRRRNGGVTAQDEQDENHHHPQHVVESKISCSLGNGSQSTAATTSLSYASDTTAYSPRHHHSKSAMVSPRMKRISKPFVYAIDCFVLLLLIQAATIHFLSDGREDANDNNSLIPATSSFRRTSLLEFQETLPNDDEPTPCTPLRDEQEISFSLAVSLVEKDLEKVPHHCKRWGIQAPISLAVWTELSPDQVRDQVTSFPSSPCHPDQLTITTLSPRGTDVGNVRNQLRNLALQGAAATHVLPLDVHMWVSVDLYETLHTPKILQALVKNPHQAVLIPAFEVNMDACKESGDIECSPGYVPRNYDDLIVHLGEKSIFPFAQSLSTLFSCSQMSKSAAVSREFEHAT
jgi:Glycosyl-transferase for dystroglycan